MSTARGHTNGGQGDHAIVRRIKHACELVIGLPLEKIHKGRQTNHTNDGKSDSCA